MDDPEVAALDFCYITTTGRMSGRPHTIEIWFALRGGSVYVLSGGGEASDWVRNIREYPTVGLRLGDRDYLARAQVIEDDAEEDALARQALLDKYGARSSEDLGEWGRTALPVRIDLPS